MDIRELFNWLQGDEKPLHLSDKVLNEGLLALEQNQAERTHQILLREVRVAKYSGGVVTEKINELEKHTLFMEYLKFCNQKFSENSLLLITLNYLLNKVQKEQTQLIAKVNQLFLILLQENKESTLAFYKKNKELFKDYHEIQEKVERTLFEMQIDEDVETVKRYLLDFNKLLSHQKNPLGIVGLFREYIGDTERFASLILWLLHRGVSAKKTLETYLLHDFLKYHFFTLHDKDNEIVRLYALLDRFPQAKTLLEAVKKTASDERGLQQYSLNGLVHEQKLQNISPQHHPFEFSQKPENFLSLHKLFGLPFLIEAVINSSEHTDPKWQELLKQALNKPQIIIEELSGIIHLIVSKCSPLVLKDLADLIDDITTQELLSNNEGAVLYLIPHKPQLFAAINKKNSTELIQQISIKHPNDPEIVYQLTALFTTFSRNKHPATSLVFQALVDNLILYPHLLEDEELLKQLKKYPESGRLLSQRYEVIAQQFNECILEQTAESAFSSRNYQIIEDNWVDATRKIAALSLIKPQTKFNFGHKYAFQAKIAEIAFLHHGEYFDLNAFIEALSLPPITSSGAVSECERVLIEILAVIDNEVLRKQIIEKLETHPIARLDWRHKEYEGKTVFLKAAKYGNLGLITLLQDEIASKSFNQAILTAAKENQWKTVDYLARLDKTLLSQDEIEVIVRLAAQQGQVNIIDYLYDAYDYEPSTDEIATILKQAITNNHLNVVKYFYQSSFAFPKQAVINSLFHLAIEVEATDVIPFIAETKQNNPTLSTIEKAFEQVTLNQQLELIQILCNLSRNTPRPVVIERTFIKACQLGLFFAAQYFYESPEKLVSQSTFKNAFEQAIANGHMEIITSFCNSSTNPPDQSVIDQGVISAAKTGKLSLVEYFCSMTSPNKPRQRALVQALSQAINHDHTEVFTTLCRSSTNLSRKTSMKDSLLLAAKKGRKEIVEYLCVNEIDALNQDAIENALILATKFRQPEIVRYLCEIPENKPGKKAIRNALNKAIGSKQTEISNYLRERLQESSTHQVKMESEVGDIQERSEPLSTHGFFKANKISQIGEPYQSNDYKMTLD
ncbi:Ankyrin repeats (3 copies) [Legionella gratiana]|uniref:Ankyrin repeats (3 copies) n=1 Tax=Legionella gratiana TaxID=45066 RepID=A0A378JHW2_9GAMM|nr:ankyrin repeat domain-containing protein [Legionella gratiana]KTD14752.1 Ankyrin repeats (3 copies) [Legionella gratiana]STX44260.1 Ankyrin repeats (3 copies) [Legionella gratiana]